jgi:hypothetical protein
LSDAKTNDVKIAAGVGAVVGYRAIVDRQKTILAINTAAVTGIENETEAV